jgi:hypothetical protein
MNTKNLFRSIILLFVTFVSTSCIFFADGIVGKGTIIAEHVAVTNFSAIESTSSADVEITKGETLEVILSDYENLLDYWDIKVINNTLVLQTKPFSSLVNTRAKVTIVMPDELYKARVAGSGDIALNSQFDSLEKVTIMGSGSFNGNANAVYSNLNLSISGSGNINLKGSADDLKTKTLGSGKMRLSQLTAQHVDCTISGSGDVYLDVENTLKATILGSGDIYYSGRPIIDIYGAGSGKLIHN